MNEKDQIGGVIADLIKPPFTETEVVEITRDYTLVRQAFEHFLAQGTEVVYPIIDRMLQGVKGKSFWTRDEQVDTPVGPINIAISTDARSALWGKTAHDIPNTKIRVFIMKENNAEPDGVATENSAYFELRPARLPLKEYVGLEEAKHLVEKLKPLADLLEDLH